jgi:hypothetical protein
MLRSDTPAITSVRPLAASLMLVASSWSMAQCPTASLNPSSQAPAPGLEPPNVDLSGDGTIAILGVPDEDIDRIGVNAGAAFVMRKDATGWTLAATLIPPGIGDGWQAGDEVEVSDDGTRALVAGPAGAWVYAFAGDMWSLEASLPIGAGSWPTGAALSGDGNVVVVREKTSPSAWVLRVFQRDRGTWSLVYTIPTMPSGQPDLGSRIDLSNDGSTIAVSQDQNAQPNAAQVRVYQRSNAIWSLETTIGPFVASPTPVLSGTGDRLFIGHGSKPQPDGSRGEVKVYDRTRDGWSEAATLIATSPAPTLYAKNFFGDSLSCSDDGTRCVVGDSTDSGAGIVTGALYRFDFDGKAWIAGPKVTLPELLPGQALGRTLSVAGDGTTALVGHFSPGWEPGSAAAVEYALDGADVDGDHVCDDDDNCIAIANAEQTDCDGNGIGDACDIAAGAPDCNADGVLDACELESDARAAYAADDGAIDTVVGYINASVVWMNHFTVQPGAEVISAIDVAWGTLPIGSPATVAVWSDPNADGVPDDGTALVTAATVVEHPFSGAFERVAVQPTFLGAAGTSVFIGAAYKNLPSIADDGPIAADVQAAPPTGSWIMAGTNVFNLDLNATPQPAVLGGGIGPFVPMVRGVVEAAPDCDADGALDACQILDDPRLDADGDGRLDACDPLADLNGDGVVNALDVAALLGAWGTAGPGDLDGDGTVGASDLAIVLAGWTRTAT